MIDVRAVLFILLMGWGLFMIPASAHAQDVLPSGPSISVPESSASLKSQSNSFYKRCISKPDPTLSDLDNEEYCICLSAQIYNKSLTPDERAYLASGQGVGMEKKRMYGEIYGPCLGIPGRAATYYACTHSADIYKFVKDEKSADLMCRCVNKELSYFWDHEVPGFLRLGKTFRREFNDPIDYIMKGRDYPGRYADAQATCVSTYGRRD